MHSALNKNHMHSSQCSEQRTRCTVLWTKISMHSAHLAALNKVHRKLDVVQVTMLAARWRIWGICRICISWRQELFIFSSIETDTDFYQTSFWHPNKVCPLQCFLSWVSGFFKTCLSATKLPQQHHPKLLLKWCCFCRCAFTENLEKSFQTARLAAHER